MVALLVFSSAAPSHPRRTAAVLYMYAHVVLSKADRQRVYGAGTPLSAVMQGAKQRTLFHPVLTPWGTWLLADPVLRVMRSRGHVHQGAAAEMCLSISFGVRSENDVP